MLKAPPAPDVRLVVEDDFSGDTLNTSLWNPLQQVGEFGLAWFGLVWLGLVWFVLGALNETAKKRSRLPPWFVVGPSTRVMPLDDER